MFPPFDENLALEECIKAAQQLKENKLSLIKTTDNKSGRDGHGLMLGVLVCTDRENERKILITNSGTTIKLKSAIENDSRIYAPPIADLQSINEALSKNDRKIHQLTDRINELKSLRKTNTDSTGNHSQTESDSKKEEKSLEKERLKLCGESLRKVFNLYKFCCSDGKTRTLQELCSKKLNGALPPGGTGDCCAPKLLSLAFSMRLKPVSMSEIFIGPSTENKLTEKSYPPCDERCSLILDGILGLNILYRDDDIIVVNKQSGLLSVPGRGADKQDCIVSRVKNLFPQCIEQPAVHRLDMETSGLMVLAFTKEAHKNLNRQFEEGKVKKKYKALLDGILPKLGIPQHGTMELYFRVDIENRPHQIWDSEYGKKAVTEWNIEDVEQYKAPDNTARNVTRVTFLPHTGRTHQLRLASADSHGFGVPIIGDTLYGNCAEGERLMLHAEELSFTHPTTGQQMQFFCKADF